MILKILKVCKRSQARRDLNCQGQQILIVHQRTLEFFPVCMFHFLT